MKFFAVLALVTVACSATPPPDPPKPSDDAGAAEPEPDAPHPPTCAGACSRLRELGCPEGEPTKKGATCEAVCENVRDSGVFLWNLSCRAHVETCAAIDSCD